MVHSQNQHQNTLLVSYIATQNAMLRPTPMLSLKEWTRVHCLDCSSSTQRPLRW